MRNQSLRSVNETIANIVLIAIVVLSWTYVILAGKFVSERYLKSIDLTEYQKNEIVPKFLDKL